MISVNPLLVNPLYLFGEVDFFVRKSLKKKKAVNSLVVHGKLPTF